MEASAPIVVQSDAMSDPRKWPASRNDELRALWARGFTASQCADQLGDGVTRNGVIGRVRRMNLERRGHHSPPRAKPLPQAPLPRPVTAEVPRPRSYAIPLLELEPGDCRWPVNDGRPVYLFCAYRAIDGSSYCQRHARMAAPGGKT